MAAAEELAQSLALFRREEEIASQCGFDAGWELGERIAGTRVCLTLVVLPEEYQRALHDVKAAWAEGRSPML